MVKKFSVWLAVCLFAALVDSGDLFKPTLLKTIKCGCAAPSFCPEPTPCPPIPIPPPCNNCSSPVPTLPPVTISPPITVLPPVTVSPPAPVTPLVTVSPPCNNCPTLDCSTAPNGALLPYANHCKLFYQCVGGSAVVSVCPNGYWYDRSLSKCVLCELVTNCPANRD